MDRANGMTPQQIRIFHLQAGRNWGPFTPSEWANLNSNLRGKQSGWTDPVDLTDRLRVLGPDESLEDLKTILMPGE